MGKVAFVTGADRGLGLSLTHWLLGDGYTVFAGRYNEDLQSLEELKSAYPEKLELVSLDVGNDQSVEAAASLIETKTPFIDLIINNAGIIDQAKNATILEPQDFEVMKQLFNVNSLGALRVTNHLVKLLLKGETKLVVNISSEAGSIEKNQRTNWYGYCMSKTALNMQSAILHKHLKSLGGQVLVFHPGWMQTYMEGFFYEKATYPPEVAADKIMNLIHDHKRFLAEEPAFIDLEGEAWPW
ncbi:SDR family NAD(P)-dependent oxidoreductase [Lederbergia panacisoli]|uniref:SDR family NAD(P)-dependent oxidoreductase n=1 Tax=Lederbergia panacisoli TaxID=1255251 RepID=UPI00214C6491|nr:SDR family NAD(P)-dependent oxidoreductase [Lederbergia panacisoli]MCR2821133.1 SDR family NAD(P)-dependent oxidoreductase [Lederbergia panacisoli]